MSSVVIKYCDDCHRKSEIDSDIRSYLHGVEIVEKPCCLCGLLTLCYLLQKLHPFPGALVGKYISSLHLPAWHMHLGVSWALRAQYAFNWIHGLSLQMVISSGDVHRLSIWHSHTSLVQARSWKASWILPFPWSPGQLFPRCCCF